MATQEMLEEILRVRLSGKTYKLLEIVARDDDRSISTLARRIIENWLSDKGNTTQSARRRAK